MERVLLETGGCGRSQSCYVATVQSCRLIAAFAMSLMIFGLYNPGWQCKSITLNDTSSERFVYSTHPMSNATARPTTMHDEKDLSATNDFPSNQSEPFSDTCDVIDSCDAIEFNSASSTIVSEFGLICDGVWKAYAIITILNAGVLLGALVWGQVGERFGRKVGLYSSTLVMGISCALAVFSPTWQVYAVFTFLIGFGNVGAVSSPSVLTMELLNSKWRARMSSIPIWNIGVIWFALFVYIFKEWRGVHLITAALSGIACLGVFWIPESFSWLLLHGKTSKAKTVASRIGRMNRRPISEDVLEELVSGDSAKKQVKHCTYLDLFRTPQIRCNIIKLGFIAIVANLVYEVIAFGIQSLPGDFYVNLILASAIELPVVLLNGPLANKIGRRRTGVVLISIGALCCAVILVLLLAVEKRALSDIVIAVMAFISKSAMAAIINILYTYSAELLPTTVRSLGMNFLIVLTRVTGLLSPYMIPRDFPSMVACFSVLMASQLAGAAVFWSLEETKDKTLRDTIKTKETSNEGEPLQL